MECSSLDLVSKTIVFNIYNDFETKRQMRVKRNKLHLTRSSTDETFFPAEIN